MRAACCLGSFASWRAAKSAVTIVQLKKFSQFIKSIEFFFASLDPAHHLVGGLGVLVVLDGLQYGLENELTDGNACAIGGCLGAFEKVFGNIEWLSHDGLRNDAPVFRALVLD